MTIHEAINEMKMCALCDSNEYSEIDGDLHRRFGYHRKGGTSYIPSPMSEEGKLHSRMGKLFKLKWK